MAKINLPPLNSKEIIKTLEPEDRTSVSFYISKKLYDKFKKGCGKAPASQVIEELMKRFLENLED